MSPTINPYVPIFCTLILEGYAHCGSVFPYIVVLSTCRGNEADPINMVVNKMRCWYSESCTTGAGERSGTRSPLKTHFQDTKKITYFTMPADYTGYWKMISNDNFEEYLKALGKFFLLLLLLFFEIYCIRVCMWLCINSRFKKKIKFNK